MRKFTKMHILFYETATTMSIDLETMQVEQWFYKETMYTNVKTADQCELLFDDTNGKQHRYLGYVPDFFPDKHYGDYIMLAISAEGKLEDFTCTDAQIEELLEEAIEE